MSRHADKFYVTNHAFVVYPERRALRRPTGRFTPIAEYESALLHLQTSPTDAGTNSHQAATKRTT